jgi:hypothetical protein
MSNCYTNTAVAGSYNDPVNGPTPVVIHYTYDNQGDPQVHITDVAGVVIADADDSNTTVGASLLPPPDVEFETLCDQQADGSSVRFARRTITSISGTGVVTVAVADFGLDYTTSYTVTGTVTTCPTCTELADRGLQAAW